MTLKATAQHTPGPWEASRMRLTPADKDRRSGFVINGPDKSELELPTRICDLRVPSGISGFAEGEANAKLIAAAPEMLAALSECITEEGSYAFGNGVDGMLRRLREINRIARAAIAKANAE